MGVEADNEQESEPPPVRAWTRSGILHSPGDDDGMLPFDDLHFHRYCAVYPYLPDDDPEIQRDHDDTGAQIRILSGVPRLCLRHTPTILALVTLAFFGTAEVSEEVQGVSAFIPPLDPLFWLGIVGVVVLYAFIITLAVKVDIFDFGEVYKALVVYGLISLLSLGTIGSILLVSAHSNPIERNIIFTSGYLLSVLLGGLLIYDGMLRTEHMFQNLGDCQIVTNSEKYIEFKEQLSADFSHLFLDTTISVLGKEQRVRLKTVYLFAILVILPYVVIWSLGVGPQNLDFSVTLLGNLIINMFIVAISFQFLVLINRFFELISDDIQGGEQILTYQPFHPDGHGGYRDFGKFATRVNVILILAILYGVYRLAIQGGRISPMEMVPGFDPLIGGLMWTLSYVMPLVLSFIVAVGWFYYTFWQIHLRMLRERERAYVGMTSTYDDPDHWDVRLNGPTWPTDFNQLVSIVGGTLGPVLLVLVEVLQ